MSQINVSEESLRRMLKQAVAEALEDRRDMIHDIVAEVLEEFAFAEAIREGQQTDEISRDEVFAALLV